MPGPLDSPIALGLPQGAYKLDSTRTMVQDDLHPLYVVKPFQMRENRLIQYKASGKTGTSTRPQNDRSV